MHTVHHAIRTAGFHQALGRTLATYRIHSRHTGLTLFEGSAWSEEDALNRMARDAGYTTYVEVVGDPANHTRDDLVVKVIED
jgi:hypothetical protein